MAGQHRPIPAPWSSRQSDDPGKRARGHGEGQAGRPRGDHGRAETNQQPARGRGQPRRSPWWRRSRPGPRRPGDSRRPGVRCRTGSRAAAVRRPRSRWWPPTRRRRRAGPRPGAGGCPGALPAAAARRRRRSSLCGEVEQGQAGQRQRERRSDATGDAGLGDHQGRGGQDQHAQRRKAGRRLRSQAAGSWQAMAAASQSSAACKREAPEDAAPHAELDEHTAEQRPEQRAQRPRSAPGRRTGGPTDARRTTAGWRRSRAKAASRRPGPAGAVRRAAWPCRAPVPRARSRRRRAGRPRTGPARCRVARTAMRSRRRRRWPRSGRARSSRRRRARRRCRPTIAGTAVAVTSEFGRVQPDAEAQQDEPAELPRIPQLAPCARAGHRRHEAAPLPPLSEPLQPQPGTRQRANC